MLSGLFALAISYSQTGSTVRHIFLKTEILNIHKQSFKGYLHSITDSAVILTGYMTRTYSDTVSEASCIKIAGSEIENISFRRRHSGARGVAFGLLTGIGLGAIIGYASYKDPGPDAWLDFGPGLDAMGGAAIGALSGGVIGLAIGSGSKKIFVIGGNKEKYREMQKN